MRKNINRIIRLLEEYEDFDENIYSRESRLHMLEDGEISVQEEAFMKGYDEAI